MEPVTSNETATISYYKPQTTNNHSNNAKSWKRSEGAVWWNFRLRLCSDATGYIGRM